MKGGRADNVDKSGVFPIWTQRNLLRFLFERFGGQKEFEFIIPPPSAMKEAAN
jgi:hypothetical protein